MRHLAGADAEGQSAERTVRAGVAVAAHNGHARLRHAHLRPHYVDDALHVALDVPQSDAEILAVLAQGTHLGRCVAGPQRNVQTARGDGMVHCGECALRAAHLQPALAQHPERLRRSDLVDQVCVDVEHHWRARVLRHHMRIPNFFKQCLAHVISSECR